MMIWLELCMSYSHHSPPPSSLAPVKSRMETFWYRLTEIHLEMAIKWREREREQLLSIVWCSLHMPPFWESLSLLSRPTNSLPLDSARVLRTQTAWLCPLSPLDSARVLRTQTAWLYPLSPLDSARVLRTQTAWLYPLTTEDLQCSHSYCTSFASCFTRINLLTDLFQQLRI